MKKLAVIIMLLINSACTTTLYVAKTDVPVNDKQCTLQTYWYKTTSPFTDKIDETYNVKLAGFNGVNYKKTDQGIVYIGKKKRDVLVYGDKPTSRKFVCGEFVGVKDIKDFDADKLNVTMNCKAGKNRRPYLPEKKTSYVLNVVEAVKEFFWFGGLPEAPKPPTCK